MYNKIQKRKLTCLTSVLDVSSREKITLLEFPVTPSTECSRVSSRSYVFTLDTDSLLITFANETGEPAICGIIFMDSHTLSFHMIETETYIFILIFILFRFIRRSRTLTRTFHSQISVIFTRT